MKVSINSFLSMLLLLGVGTAFGYSGPCTTSENWIPGIDIAGKKAYVCGNINASGYHFEFKCMPNNGNQPIGYNSYLNLPPDNSEYSARKALYVLKWTPENCAKVLAKPNDGKNYNNNNASGPCASCDTGIF